MGRKSRIDWNNIKITIVPADKENPNPLNPCSYLTQEEREQEIVTICGRIWARAMKEKMSKEANKSSNTDSDSSCGVYLSNPL